MATSPSQLPELHPDRFDHAFRLWDHIEGQVRLADTKAGLLITTQAILGAVIVPLISAAILPFIRSLDWSRPSEWPWFFIVLIMVLSVAFAGCFFWALYSVLQAVMPKYEKPGGESVFFFRDVAHKSLSKFQADFAGCDDAALGTELLSSIHSKAVWARIKFDLVRKAGGATVASIVFAAALWVATLWISPPTRTELVDSLTNSIDRLGQVEPALLEQAETASEKDNAELQASIMDLVAKLGQLSEDLKKQTSSNATK